MSDFGSTFIKYNLNNRQHDKNLLFETGLLPRLKATATTIIPP
jgi:hypothetical protein